MSVESILNVEYMNNDEIKKQVKERVRKTTQILAFVVAGTLPKKIEKEKDDSEGFFIIMTLCNEGYLEGKYSAGSCNI